MKVVIMAGGRGTRISSIAHDIPKPMIKIGEKPVLEHEIENLKAQGFTDILITVSHLGHIIMDYFGDGSKVSPVTKRPFGVKIDYYIEETPLGNVGALFQCKEKLTEDFLLLNADAMFDIDFNRMVAFHQKKGGLITLFTHPNNHPYDSGLIVADEDGQVLQWLAKEDERPAYYQNRVNAGIHIVSPALLQTQHTTEKIDLDRQLLKPLCGTGKMFVYDSSEYVKDMGTPERYQDVCAAHKSGLMQARNLKHRQRAVFLDRDGTINEYVGFLTDIDDFTLIDGVSEAIAALNQIGYLVIVVTNQPVIARGEVSFAQLGEIHNKMETLLGNAGAYLDGIYFCPHHPHGGYDGEVKELKFDCDCRKPKAGMLQKAAVEFNLDLAKCWMIGDSENDILAGKAAGCKTILLCQEKADFGQDYQCASVKESIAIL